HGGYPALHRWSVDELDTFWRAVTEWFDIRFATPYETVLADTAMPGARWFPGATLNYAEHALRAAAERPDAPALLPVDETHEAAPVTWAELRRQVGALAAELRALGVRPGDRVSGYLPNIPQAVTALLATAAVGAVWTSCAPDFGARSVLDRFQQVEPVVLITVDGYRYGGKVHDRTGTVAELRRELPTLRAVVHIPLIGTDTPDGALDWAAVTAGTAEPRFEQVPFDHPLWVLYSSGTTGLPKAIVQSQGGILLEHLKQLSLHCDLGPEDRFFWYTSTGWMMWNFLVSGLLTGTTVVLYDGSPGHPSTGAQWSVAERTGATFFGTSAAYVMACRKAGVHPARDHDLSRVACVATTGSPLPPDGFRWLHDELAAAGPERWIASVSGGTDVCSCFAGAVPTLPVHIGELQAACLGTDLQSWDPHGNPLVGEVGELVVTRPMPSMPIRFWNDPDGSRYRDSYFEMFPGVWRHGDWITLTERGSVIIHGRSDSTLNRQGVRMGSADIYEAVERLPEIRESLVIGVEEAEGGYWMPLFVQLAEGATLDDALRDRIKQIIREQLSPRHLPDDIIEIPA
ncbi:acetoacetate--CoA ligase, partial [Streptomyces clavuligerus]